MDLLNKGIAGLMLGLALVAGAMAQSGDQRQRLERDGIIVEFEALGSGADGVLMEGGQAELRFHIRDASGHPLSGMNPGAWVDQTQVLKERDGRQLDCKARIAIYLKGVMGARPMLDLNSYFLLVLNQDPSITVIDPSISVGGITSTYARIPLKRPPMDWVAAPAERRLYVSLPSAGEVAVVSTDTFAVIGYVAAGREPMRVALQPDGRYLWVGDKAGGVSVIDTATLQPVATLPAGRGHHEINFSSDSRHAFVSNRDSGNVSVFDVASLRHLKELETGPHPLAVAYSPLSQAMYVSDGQTGAISVIDVRTLELRNRIITAAGTGPIRFSADGRYGFALNSLTHQALVIDASSDRIVHEIEVSPEPYQVIFTRAYAYIRGLASARVSMISLASLGEGKQPMVQAFDAGSAAPQLAGALPLADSMTQVRADASVFVVNPVDNTAYYYMEGMNAPMSAYLNRGHSSRGAMVIDRSLREREPGVYSSRVTLPAHGEFDVAFMLNQPELTHCFTTVINRNPALAEARNSARVTFLMPPSPIRTGQPVTARFRIERGAGGGPWVGADDVQVRYFLAPSSQPRWVTAVEVEEGIYEAPLELDQAGAWYVHVGSSSLGLEGINGAYTSLRAVTDVSPESAARLTF